MHLDFELTADDAREVRRIARKNPSRQSKRAHRALLGWLVFLALVGCSTLLVNRPSAFQARRSPVVAVRSDFSSSSADWILLGVALIVVFWLFYRNRFPNEQTLLRSIGKQRLVSMDIEPDGVFSDIGTSKTHWRWNAFDRVIESERGFFLRLTDSLLYLIIPKRAFQESQSREQVRELLQGKIQPTTGAFPVVLSTKAAILQSVPD